MGDVLTRHLGGRDAIDPGQWMRTAGRPLLRCGDCGGVDSLPETHEVSPDGRVVPVWRCSTATCSARRWLWLEAYEP